MCRWSWVRRVCKRTCPRGFTKKRHYEEEMVCAPCEKARELAGKAGFALDDDPQVYRPTDEDYKYLCVLSDKTFVVDDYVTGVNNTTEAGRCPYCVEKEEENKEKAKGRAARGKGKQKEKGGDVKGLCDDVDTLDLERTI